MGENIQSSQEKCKSPSGDQRWGEGKGFVDEARGKGQSVIQNAEKYQRATQGRQNSVFI